MLVCVKFYDQSFLVRDRDVPLCNGLKKLNFYYEVWGLGNTGECFDVTIVILASRRCCSVSTLGVTILWVGVSHKYCRTYCVSCRYEEGGLGC